MLKPARNASSWLESVPDKKRYPTLSSEESADVVVIGGGIVGVMAAWCLADRGKTVILLEKGRVAGGDTSYTTALVTRVPDAPCAALAKRYGRDFLRDVFTATLEAQDYLRQLVKREGIGCDFTECSSYNCAYIRGDNALKEEWSAMEEACGQSRFVSGTAAAAAGASISEAILVGGEARFDVRKFVFGLLGRPGAKSLRIYEESEVMDVDDSDGVVVKTAAGGTVRAKKAIIATGMPLPQFELPRLLEHYISFAIAADYPNGAPFSDDIFWDTCEPYFYYRRLDSHRIIVGGADVRAGEMRGAEEGHKKLNAFLDETFPGKHAVTNAWSGSIFSLDDGLPYVGEHPSHPGKVFVAAGFGGNGIVMGVMAGMILADITSGRENKHARLFSFSRKMDGKGAEKPSSGAAPNPASALVPLAYLALIAIPAFFFFSAHGGFSFLAGADLKTLSYLLFPLLGLYAFTLVWIQAITGSNMDLLGKSFPGAEKFHRAEGALALVFALAHPLMLLAGVGLASFVAFNFVPAEMAIFAWLGILQLLIITCTAVTAMLMSHPWLKTRWRMIHLANYALFFIAWVHSWFLGHDVQSTPLRYVWIFYAATVAASVAFRAARARGVRKIIGDGNMEKFVRVGSVKDVVEGKPHCAEANGIKIALFKVNGKYYALENSCSHAGGPLCGGSLEGSAIKCPWHGTKFDVATGNVVAPPASVPQKAFAVRVSGEDIEVMVGQGK